MQQTVSIWMHSGDMPVQGCLKADAQADVCIIGAGISGLTTAYLLLRQEKSVVVLDDGAIGGGQTERTTAHLSNAIDDRYFRIESIHGRKGARLAAESHTHAIDQVESIVWAENIECDFERLDGYLFRSPNDPANLLESELRSAHRAGLVQVEMVERCPLIKFDTGPCLCFPGQAQFHPRKYLAGLTKAILRRGGAVYTQTHVVTIENRGSALIWTEDGPCVRANSVVVATNTPFNDLVTMHTKQAPYTTYAMAFGVPRGTIKRALFWDTERPYHYVRLHSMPESIVEGETWGDPRTEELLIVGGEDHKTGQANDAEDRYDRIEAWTRERFPIIGHRRCRWSGQVMETIDGLAFIGRNPLDDENVYIATGDSGQGMTHGTIAGMLITDMIVGKKNEWERLYDPRRKSLFASWHYLEENINVALQYGDWLVPGDYEKAEDIPPGQGGIVAKGLKKSAVYRDELSNQHEFSAVCPHLGCIVRWNQNENSWDCPCHGSRFDKFGRLLCGPANQDLSATHVETEIDSK